MASSRGSTLTDPTQALTTISRATSLSATADMNLSWDSTIAALVYHLPNPHGLQQLDAYDGTDPDVRAFRHALNIGHRIQGVIPPFSTPSVNAGSSEEVMLRRVVRAICISVTAFAVLRGFYSRQSVDVTQSVLAEFKYRYQPDNTAQIATPIVESYEHHLTAYFARNQEVLRILKLVAEIATQQVMHGKYRPELGFITHPTRRISYSVEIHPCTPAPATFVIWLYCNLSAEGILEGIQPIVPQHTLKVMGLQPTSGHPGMTGPNGSCHRQSGPSAGPFAGTSTPRNDGCDIVNVGPSSDAAYVAPKRRKREEDPEAEYSCSRIKRRQATNVIALQESLPLALDADDIMQHHPDKMSYNNLLRVALRFDNRSIFNRIQTVVDEGGRPEMTDPSGVPHRIDRAITHLAERYGLADVRIGGVREDSKLLLRVAFDHVRSSNRVPNVNSVHWTRALEKLRDQHEERLKAALSELIPELAGKARALPAPSTQGYDSSVHTLSYPASRPSQTFAQTKPPTGLGISSSPIVSITGMDHDSSMDDVAFSSRARRNAVAVPNGDAVSFDPNLLSDDVGMHFTNHGETIASSPVWGPSEPVTSCGYDPSLFAEEELYSLSV